MIIALQLYKSLVVPYFDFGDIIYQHTSNDNLFRLQVLQNCACRMILRTGRYASTSEMHNKLNITTLTERRLYHSAVFMFKIVKGLITCRTLRSVFITVDECHGVNTRAYSRGDLHIQASNTQFGERSIHIFGSRVWNMLPQVLRTLNTVQTFRTNYWKMVMSN